MIRQENDLFILETEHTSYLFCRDSREHLVHLYYGARIPVSEGDIPALHRPAVNTPGCSILYDEADQTLSMDHLPQEIGCEGCGDLRTPAVRLVYADGSSTTDFLFSSAEILPGAHTMPGLPGGHDESGQAETLLVHLQERNHDLTLTLQYTVYPQCDCIVRAASLTNHASESVALSRFASLQLELPEPDWRFLGFQGDWTLEMQPVSLPICGTELYHHSTGGFSSNRANPLFLISRLETTETHGDCIGCNLIYSGNHAARVQMHPQGSIRVISGMDDFSWELYPEETFCAPQAVITFSEAGYEGISHRFHKFVQNHIIPQQWAGRPRPVLVNSWEAAYFRFDERRLLALAKAAQKVGAELFVLDDGWFGQRNSDNCSLGDWEENPQKLPSGLSGFQKKLAAMGMELGLWVEPEMVSPDSNLYRMHPDWAVEIPGQHHSQGRHQLLLDMSRQEVQDYVLMTMSHILFETPIRYLKWDMNRNFSDIFSQAGPDQQGFLHRYMLGLYRVLDKLTREHPQVLFEACASGGNRFDLGMLCYMPQVWASDNTDAISRGYIQNGYSYGYPPSVLGAHISGCPNHQTLRSTPLETRFAVSIFGLLGYEMDLTACSDRELAQITHQIALYKQWREIIMTGTFYRLGGRLNSLRPQAEGLGPWSRNSGDLIRWAMVDTEKNKAIIMTLQETTQPNCIRDLLKLRGLDADKHYRLTNLPVKWDIRRFGDLVNTLSPVRIRQNGAVHNLAAHFIQLESEQLDITASGALLERAGVDLPERYAGTGYDPGTRLYQDFDSRLYLLEAIDT